MNALLEKIGLCAFVDKFLHLHEFVYTTSFETLRIMKDEFVVAPENEFILDVMHSTLNRVDYDMRLMSARTWRDIRPPGPLDLRRIDLIARLRINTTTYVDMDPYLVPITVVDLRVFRSVADPLENGRLASVRPPDDKNPETAEFISKVFETT